MLGERYRNQVTSLAGSRNPRSIAERRKEYEELRGNKAMVHSLPLLPSSIRPQRSAIIPLSAAVKDAFSGRQYHDASGKWHTEHSNLRTVAFR